MCHSDVASRGGLPIRTILLLVLALFALPLALAATGATVSITDFKFTDDQSGTSVTTLHVGESVVWRWDGGAIHSATQAPPPPLGPNGLDAPFDSGVHGRGATYSVAFGVPGAFRYVCKIHASMTGTILVTP